MTDKKPARAKPAAKTDSDAKAEAPAKKPAAAAKTKPASATASSASAEGSAPRDQPIDAEFTPASPVLPSFDFLKQKAVSMPVALGLALAAALVGGLIGVVFDGGGGGDRLSRDLAQRLDAQESRLDAVRNALTSSDGASLDAAAVADIAADVAGVRGELRRVASRVAVIEAAGGDRDGVADVSDRLERVAAEVSEARRIALDAAAAPDAQAAEIASLRARVDSLTEALDAQQRALTQISNATSRIAGRLTGVTAPIGPDGAGPAAALALAEVQEAAAGGRAFADELAELRRYAGDVAALDALDAYAAAGAPTYQDLSLAFPQVARAVRDAEAGDGGGLVDRFGRAMTGLVSVRRLDAPETDAVGDIVVRARARVQEGDIAGAVVELERLRDAPAAAAQDWITDARRRIELDMALTSLRDALRGGGG